jgi:uncharacterized membrane protein
MKKIILFTFIAIGLCLSLPVLAQEVIDNFEVTININPDASITVSEKIDYNFGGEQKHGIYRDIPVKYKARGGNYNLRITDLAVTDAQGKPYLFEVLNKGKYKCIKIGDPQGNVTGKKEYIINYQVKRAINYFFDHDELYWNVTGNEWLVPIGQSKAIIVLPGSINAEEITVDCFAGPTGSTNHCVSDRYVYSGQNMVNKLVFTDDKLKAGEGLTVVVGFPKGIVAKPSFFDLAWETFRDNWVLAIPFITFIVLFYLWFTRGRDPKGRGTIIAQYQAPNGLTPAEAGTIIDEKAHKHDISAEIINLAIKGYLKINRIEGKGILKSDDYELHKLREGDDLVNKFESKLFKALFSLDKKVIKLSELKNKFYKDLEKIKKEIYQSTVTKKYFLKNPNKVRGAYLGIGIVILVLSWFSGPIYSWFGVISLAISGLLIIIFSFFMPRKTRQGVLAKEHILGLKQYLTVAEKDRIKFHNAPEKNPKHFEKLLPYAMVLGVEQDWAKQFEGIYDKQPDWYNDSSGAHFSAFALASSLNSFQTKANTTLASRPSSASSGGSGFSGGFSGGGFGGGGGGSW